MDFLEDIPAATANTAMRPHSASELGAPKMTLREKFTRISGVGAGLVTSILLPHVFCLGPILMGVVGSGVAASEATTISYMAGGILVLGAGITATYGFGRSDDPCCIKAETLPASLKKAGLMAITGLALGGIINTGLGRGLSDPALSAQAIQVAFWEGRSVWDVLVQICTTGRLTP